MVENLKDFEKYIRDLIKASDPVEAELLDAAIERAKANDRKTLMARDC